MIKLAIIKKLPGTSKYRLYSRKKDSKGKRKNLGTYDTLKGAQEREKQITFFKLRNQHADDGAQDPTDKHLQDLSDLATYLEDAGYVKEADELYADMDCLDAGFDNGFEQPYGPASFNPGEGQRLAFVRALSKRAATMSKPDAGKILGVDPSAPTSEIEAAWRKLVLIKHPDRNKAPDAEEQTKAINTARDVLLAGRTQASPPPTPAPQSVGEAEAVPAGARTSVFDLALQQLDPFDREMYLLYYRSKPRRAPKDVAWLLGISVDDLILLAPYVQKRMEKLQNTLRKTRYQTSEEGREAKNLSNRQYAVREHFIAKQKAEGNLCDNHKDGEEEVGYFVFTNRGVLDTQEPVPLCLECAGKFNISPIPPDARVACSMPDHESGVFVRASSMLSHGGAFGDEPIPLCKSCVARRINVLPLGTYSAQFESKVPIISQLESAREDYKGNVYVKMEQDPAESKPEAPPGAVERRFTIRLPEAQIDFLDNRYVVQTLGATIPLPPGFTQSLESLVGAPGFNMSTLASYLVTHRSELKLDFKTLDALRKLLPGAEPKDKQAPKPPPTSKMTTTPGLVSWPDLRVTRDGDQYVLIVDGFKVKIPARLTPQFAAVLGQDAPKRELILLTLSNSLNELGLTYDVRKKLAATITRMLSSTASQEEEEDSSDEPDNDSEAPTTTSRVWRRSSSLIPSLVKLANHLDEIGATDEADELDALLEELDGACGDGQFNVDMLAASNGLSETGMTDNQGAGMSQGLSDSYLFRSYVSDEGAYEHRNELETKLSI